jgi:hypothetical protein
MLRNQHKFREAVFTILMLAGTLILVGGFAVLPMQAILLFRDGHWTEPHFRVLWHIFGVSEPDFPAMRGLQKMIVWYLSLPLSLGLMGVGITLFYSGWGLKATDRTTKFVRDDVL